MPIIAMPDGANVEFPDDMPPEKIKALIASKFPDAVNSLKPMTAEETAKDALIGTGSGVAGGVLDMAGLPANVASLGRAGASKLGVGEDTLNTVSNFIKKTPWIGGLLNASKGYNNWRETGTDDFNKYLNYDPKDQAGKYGKRIGGFAPAVIGGPGGMGARAL